MTVNGRATWAFRGTLIDGRNDDDEGRVGAELRHYDVDVRNATLAQRDSVTLPDSVQYAWPHPSRQYLYVAWSNGSDRDHHGVTGFRIDSTSGALHPNGNPVLLMARPIHASTDIDGTHLLVAYNDPSGVTVHQIEESGYPPRP